MGHQGKHCRPADIYECGLYRCIEGRCRSCIVDDDCGGDSKCYHEPDREGAVCDRRTDPEPEWEPLEWCDSDQECGAAEFCDLHRCMVRVAGSPLGAPCTGSQLECQTYLCREGRCRSCSSRASTDCAPGLSCDFPPAPQSGLGCIRL